MSSACFMWPPCRPAALPPCRPAALPPCGHPALVPVAVVTSLRFPEVTAHSDSHGTQRPGARRTPFRASVRPTYSATTLAVRSPSALVLRRSLMGVSGLNDLLGPFLLIAEMFIEDH